MKDAIGFNAIGVTMGDIEASVSFEPDSLKAFSKNEVEMKISVKGDGARTYWCECDINAKAPLSLAHDMALENGRIRIGILKPSGEASKSVKLYTLPNNFPDEYMLKLTVYVYDEDGAIYKRIDSTKPISCVQMDKTGSVAKA